MSEFSDSIHQSTMAFQDYVERRILIITEGRFHVNFINNYI